MRKLLLLIFSLIFSLNISYAQDPHWIVYTSQNYGLPELQLYGIAIDIDNEIWITAENSIIRFDGHNWVVFDSSNSIIPSWSYSGVIERGGDGNVWIGGYIGFEANNIGLVNVSTNPWTIYDSSNSQLAFNSIAGLSPSRDGGIWINSWPGHLTYPGTVQKLANENWYSSSQQTINYCGEMEEDKNGNLWYTNEFASGGVFKINQDTTIWYQFLDGGATTIETDLNGNVWMGWARNIPDSSGLLMYNGLEWNFYNQNNSNLPAYWIRNLVADSLGNLWMSGDGLIKFDGLEFSHYTPQNSGLYSTDINDIQIDDLNDKWIIHPDAISIYNEDGFLSVKNKKDFPENLILSQNFPNPFNPTTKIKFTISDLRFTTLKVYDVLGNEIATLVNEEKLAGKYEVEFNAEELSSGIYFYQLKAGASILTKKMILLK